MESIKIKFHIDNLLDIFAFIDLAEICEKISIEDKNRKSIIEYANLLKTTKLTKEMFIGEKAIFEGFKVIVKTAGIYKVTNRKYDIRFNLASRAIDLISIDEYYLYHNKGYIKTLADLATLTKDNPLKLK